MLKDAQGVKRVIKKDCHRADQICYYTQALLQ